MGKCHFTALLLSAVFLIVWPAGCQDKDEGILPDRPDPSGVVIPKGSLQFENGVAWTIANGTRTLNAPESLLRFGLGSKTGLRLGLPDYFLGLGRHELASGFADVLIGMKQQIISHEGGFNLSIIPALSVPTGAESRSSHSVDPELQVPFSVELKNKWLLGTVLTIADPTDHARRNFTGEALFYIARDIARNTEAFIAYVGDSRPFAHRKRGQQLPVRHSQGQEHRPRGRHTAARRDTECTLAMRTPPDPAAARATTHPLPSPTRLF